ncbi:MAG TPA: methyltransferase domain-containing protein [Rhodothermales bacterium]
MSQPINLSVPSPWNEVATGYAEEVLPMFTLYAQDALRLAEVPEGAEVLDVACGPGTLALLAAERARRVVAVDFAPEMLEVLRARAAEEGITNIEARVADGQMLPFIRESFDRAFSMFGLIFFPDRSAGFREMRRVLRPGGRAVVSSWRPLEHVPLLKTFYEALGEELNGFPFGDGKAPLGDEESLRGEMQDAGFRSVRVHPVSHSVTVPSTARFWDANQRSSAPLAILRRSVTPERWDEIGRRVVDRLRSEVGEGPVEMSWPALIAVADRG